MIRILDIGGLIFGVMGAILVGQLSKWGFIAFIAGSSMHGILGHMNKNYGLVATCATFIIIDIYYFLKWGGFL